MSSLTDDFISLQPNANSMKLTELLPQILWSFVWLLLLNILSSFECRAFPLLFLPLQIFWCRHLLLPHLPPSFLLPFISAEFSSDLDFYSTSSSLDSFFSTIRIPPPLLPLLLSPAPLNYFSSSCRSCSNFKKPNKSPSLWEHLTSPQVLSNSCPLSCPVFHVCLSIGSIQSSPVSRCHYSFDKTLQKKKKKKKEDLSRF
jgi:hypothetical protein